MHVINKNIIIITSTPLLVLTAPHILYQFHPLALSVSEEEGEEEEEEEEEEEKGEEEEEEGWDEMMICGCEAYFKRNNFKITCCGERERLPSNMCSYTCASCFSYCC